jgi:RHS repeat-associated protein
VGGVTPTYDANGNLTNDGLQGYSWDADGNPVSLSSVILTFDALDRMVEQNNNGSYTQIVYGPGGGKLALMSGQTLSKAFVPLSAGATAVYNASGLAYYRHADWLGSSRFASTPSRTMYYDGAYAPYGENYAETGTQDRSFTGQNQDTISTGPYPLYDFLYREYHPTWGRWLSPDPAGLAAVDPTNPQSWNRYAYVMNNATTFTDPQGLCAGDADDASCSSVCGFLWGMPYPCTWTLDGVVVPAQVAEGMLIRGTAVQCPNNDCSAVYGKDPYTGDQAWLLPAAGAGGATGYLSVQDWSKGVNEVNGTFLSNAQYDAYIQAAYSGDIKAQQEALARAIAAQTGMPYNQVLNALSTKDGSLKGGNYDFAYDNSVLNADTVCGAGNTRCGGIHFADDLVHLDTANPWTDLWGLAQHAFVDVFLGNFAYTVIPRPWL